MVEVTLKDIAQSIDDLAVLTNKGFGRVEKKLSEHDKKFEYIDQRLDTLERDVSYIRDTYPRLNSQV